MFSETGEYYLQGVAEMASGFLLKPDNTFQFFFIYGALDRHGSGTWKEKDGHIILNSPKDPPEGYTLVSSRRQRHNFINILLEGNNKLAMNHSFVSLSRGIEGSWKQMDHEGVVQFPAQQVESISLILEFCPERITTIPINEPDHNEFVFRIEPEILEVFFHDFSLKFEEHCLIGGHPLLHKEDLHYAKQ